MKKHLLFLFAALLPMLASAQQFKTGEILEYTHTNGETKSYMIVGENLIENPSFDNGTEGWTGGAGGALESTEINYSGGVDGGAYIRPTGFGGKGSNNSIGVAWDVEVGKTYVFSFFLKNQTNTNAESPAGDGFIKVSMSDTYRDETLVLQPLPHVDAGLAWTQNTWVVEAKHKSLALCARWLAGEKSFDAFVLAEAVELPNGENTLYGEDVTDLLTNSDFEDGANGWTIIGGNKIAAIAANYGYHATNFIEDWVAAPSTLGDKDWSQTIEVPNGIYVVRSLAHAILQSDAGLSPEGVYFYANKDEVQITTSHQNPPAEYSVSTVVTDGRLKVGYRITSCNVNWAAWDYVRIYKYDAATEEEALGMYAKDEMLSLVPVVEELMNSRFQKTLKEDIIESISNIHTIPFDEATACLETLRIQIKEAEDCIIGYEKLREKLEYAYSIKDRGYQLGLDSFEEVITEKENAYECALLSSKDVRDAINELEDAIFSFFLLNANGTDALDVTDRFITNPTMRENSIGWEGSRPGLEFEVQEFYNCDFDMYQTLTGIPNGMYKVYVQGFYRTGGNDGGAAYNAGTETITAELYANEASTFLTSVYKYKASAMGVAGTGVSNDYLIMRNATNEAFNLTNPKTGKLYYDENTVIVIVQDGNLKIGLRNSEHKGSSWCAFRDFRLEYLGGESFSLSDCGPNLKWSLEKGKLLIEGEGAMYDFSSESEVPWIESQKEITDVVLNHGVSSIGEFAFSGCTNLSSITIPASVNKIGKHAFSSCSSLTSVTIPEGVTSIGDGTFSNCSKLTSIVIPSSITCIEQNAFRACLRLESVAIPNSVTDIGNSAFAFCYNLENLTIGNSVTNIEECAFQACGLKSLEIPNSVKTLGRAAFANCSKLTSIIIPKSITNMGDNPFSDCPGLESIIVEEANSVYDSRNNCNAIIHKETNVLISGCKNTIIPNGVTRIGNSAFHNCDGLTSIVIPNSVTTIGNMAFCACDGLTSIVIPNSVTTIGDIAFENSSRDKGLNHVTIGSNVTSIGVRAFDCYSITSIKSLIPSERLLGLYNNVFDTRVNKNKCTLFVPQDAINKYKTTDGWKDFTNIQEITNKVTYIINGEIFAIYDVAYGTNIPKPSKAEHTLICDEIPETMPAEDITIIGSFIANKYLVTFKIGDEVIAADSIEYGAAIITPEAPEKEGYTFNGWGEIPETMPAKDITITGTFIANKYLITFMIDGVVISSELLEYGSTITAPNVPEREGYTFNGWGEVAATVPAGDVTYEGSYSVNSYLLTFVVDGEIKESESVPYGTAIVAPEVPEKEGYTFSGWSEIPETMPANDITITGTFTVNKYLVTFEVDGIVISSKSLEYGSTITVPTMPEREGYTFSGWGDVDETVPASDVTYHATYIANTYKVYYFVGATLVHIAEVAYGEAIPEYIYEPTTEGDVFMGWIGETYDTMPAHDVTYTANIVNDIEQVMIDNGQLTIYDLSGRNVTNMENLKGGIYIVNGRKVIVK